MAANPSSLYLMTPPSTQTDTNVKLTLVKSKGSNDSGISQAELLAQLCAMIQLLHTVEGELATNQAQLAKDANSVSGVLVAGTNEQVQEAQKQEKAYQASLHESFWEKLKDIFLKYIVPVIMAIVAVVVTVFTFGAGAAIVAAVVIAAVLILTTPIPGLNTSLLNMAATGIAESLGKDFGWSAAKIQEVKGYINLALAVVVAVIAFVVTLGAGAGATVTAIEESATEIGEEGIEMADMAAEEGSSVAQDGANALEDGVENTASSATKQAGISAKGAAYFAIQAFSAQTANSNAFSDIVIGSWLNQNPNDEANAKKIGGIIATILNLLVQIAALVAGGMAMSSAPSSGASLGSLLGASASTVLRGAALVTTGVTVAGAANNFYEGAIDIEVGKILAALTKALGNLKVSEELSQQVNGDITQINAIMKSFSDQFSRLLKQTTNYAAVEKSEAEAMLQVFQQA